MTVTRVATVDGAGRVRVPNEPTAPDPTDPGPWPQHADRRDEPDFDWDPERSFDEATEVARAERKWERYGGA